MEKMAKVAGHPVHQMLIVFPLGLLATGVIFDVIYLATGNGRWADVAFYLIGAGIIGALVAAPFGFWDWLTIPANTRAKAVGLWHGGGNLLVAALFAVSWFVRYPAPDRPDVWALAISFLGAGLSVITGWLGGELVDRLGVGVDAGAHLNSPSSLSGRPASEQAQGDRLSGLGSGVQRPV